MFHKKAKFKIYITHYFIQFITVSAEIPISKHTEIIAKNDYKFQQRSDKKDLNAFYYRAQLYTMVPHHMHEDLKQLANAGTNGITIAVLELDFDAVS